MQWFSHYTRFITHYAALAQSVDVDQFSVGTDLAEMAIKQENRCRKMVQAVRLVYNQSSTKGRSNKSSSLVYTANRGTADKIQWWDAVDGISIASSTSSISSSVDKPERNECTPKLLAKKECESPRVCKKCCQNEKKIKNQVSYINHIFCSSHVMQI